MIDTITVTGFWPLKESLGRGKHTLGKLRIWVEEGSLVRFEVSLPRLLFGHNGRCFANQEELDSAVQKCWQEVQRLADVSEPRTWKVIRLDLTWNFPLPARPLIVSHRTLKVPGIQGGATLHSDEKGVSWRGRGSRFIITMYDKARQMRVVGTGDVLRAEVSMRGNALTDRLGGHNWICFAEMYSLFRRIMIAIPGIQRPAQRCAGWIEAASQLPFENRLMFQTSLAHHRSGRLWTNKIELLAGEALIGPFSWSDHLPVEGPHEPALVEPRERAAQVHCNLESPTSTAPPAKKAAQINALAESDAA